MTLRTLISLSATPALQDIHPMFFYNIKNFKFFYFIFFFSLIPCIFLLNSGNKEITWMMLEAGAETDVVNSVGRTAAQMAAFVGKVKVCCDLLNS